MKFLHNFLKNSFDNFLNRSDSLEENFLMLSTFVLELILLQSLSILQQISSTPVMTH